MKIEIIQNSRFAQPWSFRLVSNNGHILCVSEKYTNFSDVVAAVDLIQKHAGTAEIINVYKTKK